MKNPENLIDLVEYMGSYINEIRSAGSTEESMARLNFIKEYAKKTVNELEKDNSKNRILITQLTDTFYRKFGSLEYIDTYTNIYIGSIFYEIFWLLGQQKGVHIFYVLDNTLRDDRLYLILQQFPPAGFAVITPHITDNLKYEATNTLTHNLSYEEVEIKIKEALASEKNIIYIERDSSVDYLDKVAQLAKQAGDEYAKIYRNSGYESPEIHNIENITKIGTIK